MRLFFIMADDSNLDSFVRALTSSDALTHWKQYHRGKYDPGEDEVSICEVPEMDGVPGVVPWDTLKIDDDVEL